jgi:hypothetical protein
MAPPRSNEAPGFPCSPIRDARSAEWELMSALSLTRSVRAHRFQMHHYRNCAGDPLSRGFEPLSFAYFSLRQAVCVKVVVGVPRRKATVRRCTCCIRDEGRPLGVADQAVIPNHPELHSLRAGVVSVCGKGGMNPVRCAVRRRTKVNHRRSVDNCNDVKTEDSTTPRDQSNGNLKVGLTASGIEVARPFCRRGYGTWEPVVSMSREKLKRRTRESESTDARHRGGVMRSSVEGVVMTFGAKA